MTTDPTEVKLAHDGEAVRVIYHDQAGRQVVDLYPKEFTGRPSYVSAAKFRDWLIDVLRVRVDTTPEPPEAAHYEITVWADAEIGEAGSDALFDRVAAAAHELDEQLFCFSKLVPGPVGAVTAPTEPESTSELIRQAERGFIKATEILGSGASTEPETP